MNLIHLMTETERKELAILCDQTQEIEAARELALAAYRKARHDLSRDLDEALELAVTAYREQLYADMVEVRKKMDALDRAAYERVEGDLD